MSYLVKKNHSEFIEVGWYLGGGWNLALKFNFVILVLTSQVPLAGVVHLSFSKFDSKFNFRANQ